MARVTGYQRLLAAHQREQAKKQAEAPPLPPAPLRKPADRMVHAIRDIKVTKEIGRIFEGSFDAAGVVRDVEVRCGPVKGAPVTAALHYNGFLARTMPMTEGTLRLDFSGYVIRPGDRVEVFARCDGEAVIESLTISFRFEAIP